MSELGEGTPLDSTTASRMGGAFNTSFADVRIHTDEVGGKLAQDHGARAFTVGSHVAFAPGNYAPGTVEGDALLAHELTHVLQQRGSAPGAPQKKALGIGDRSNAESDADHGAAAAVARLHGDPNVTAEPATSTLSSDFQLQRWEGTADAPGIDHGIFDGDFKFHNDPFFVRLRIQNAMRDQPRAGTVLTAEFRYVGQDDADGHVVGLSLPLPAGKTPKPKVTPDFSDEWVKLDVDVFGDGSWVGTISRTTIELDGWNPKSRLHRFRGKQANQPANEAADIVIKSKQALPGTDTTTSQVVAPITPLRIDLAAISASRWLEELVTDPAYSIDASVEPWKMLRGVVAADKLRFGREAQPTPPQGASADEALRLTRLGEAITRARPMLKALGAASKKEAYLPDIANECIALVAGVRSDYADAVRTSYDAPADDMFALADQSFNTVWYRITSIYLAQGKGAGQMLTDAQLTADEIAGLRTSNQRAASLFPKLESMLRVRAPVARPGPAGSNDNPNNLVAQTTAKYKQIRDDFMFGKPGVLAKAAEVVEDAQLALGLAAILLTNEVFHAFKNEMSGITGGVFDRVGRNLSNVCDTYVTQFEGLAAGVEGQLAGGVDIHAAGKAAVIAYQAVITSKTFHDDADAIKSRIKTVTVINTLAKVLAIAGAAALTGGAAAAAVGGALEGAGFAAGGAAALSGAFVAEVVTFTVVSRIGNEVAFGKNESGWTEDLITNGLMLGFLKTAAAAYGRVFKLFGDPRLHKTAFLIGGALTSMGALQGFAEVHYRLKEGKWMDNDERARGVMSNAIMLAALSMGGFLGKPINERIRNDMRTFAARNTPGRLEAVEAKIAGLKGEVDALKAQGARGGDAAAALLNKIEKLWNEQLSVLAEAAKSEKAKKAEATKAFQDTVDTYVKEVAALDLKLAQSGLDIGIDAGAAAKMFRPISPGFVAYKAEAFDILKDFYEKENHSNGGKLEKVKEGVYSGKAGGEEVFYVIESQVEGVFAEVRAKPPTEKEAAANRAAAKRARAENLARSHDAEKLLVTDAVDGHCKTRFTRMVGGVGLAAAMDATGVNKGAKVQPIKALPKVLGLGTGEETFGKLRETPVGQAAPELDSDGWAPGASPRDMTADHGHYTTSSTIADAIALTQLRSGVPIVDCTVLEVSIKHDSSWKMTDAKVRVKIKLTSSGHELFLYGDFSDIATGLGPPNEVAPGQINADNELAKKYKAALLSSKRLVMGDEVGVQKSGKVLVSGGSATAAWNARVARKLGAIVDWIARAGRDPINEAAKREFAQNKAKLESGTLSPAEAQRLTDRQAELRAFDAAMLPANVQPADAAFNDVGVTRYVKEIASMTPTEHIPGEAPGRVKVTFTDGSAEIYDQVVASHSASLGASMAKEAPLQGALTLAKGIELRPLVVNGEVVALESIDPPGAVRVIGAAMWSPGWFDSIPASAKVNGENALALYKKALGKQAEGAPRDSPANPLIRNVGRQIPAANSTIR